MTNKDKEEVLKYISGKSGESVESLEKEYQQLVAEISAKKIPNPEQKAIIKLKHSYDNKLRSGGQKIFGYITSYNAVSDTNDYTLKTAKLLFESKDAIGIAEFEKKQYCKIASDGTVLKKSKDGRDYIVSPKIQRTISGFCKYGDNDFQKFTMYWKFNSVEEAKSVIAYAPVEFRAIPKPQEDGKLILNAVPETEFKRTNEPMPSLEELLPKMYPEGPISPQEMVKSNEKRPVFVKCELYGYMPNPKYGDRLSIPLGGDMTLEDADEVTAQLSKDFNMKDVQGWDEGVVTLVWGTYNPYTNKKDGKFVRKIDIDGMYVMTKDRAIMPISDIKEEKTPAIKNNW